MPHGAGPCSHSPSSGRGVSAMPPTGSGDPCVWLLALAVCVWAGAPVGQGGPESWFPPGQAPLASLWPVAETRATCPGKGDCTKAEQGQSGAGPDSAGLLGPEGPWRIYKSGGFGSRRPCLQSQQCPTRPLRPGTPCALSLILACHAPEMSLDRPLAEGPAPAAACPLGRGVPRSEELATPALHGGLSCHPGWLWWWVLGLDPLWSEGGCPWVRTPRSGPLSGCVVSGRWVWPPVLPFPVKGSIVMATSQGCVSIHRA